MLVAVLLAAAVEDDDHDDDDEVVANSDADDVAEEHAPVNDSMDSLCARLNNLVMKDDVSRATILIPDYCFHFVSCNCSLTVRAVYMSVAVVVARVRPCPFSILQWRRLLTSA
jgi:hypothetical protein